MNCYIEQARLFVIGNYEIKPREGTTQAHPTATGAYTLGVNPLICILCKFVFINEHTNTEGKKLYLLTILQLQERQERYWDILQQHGPLFGYFPKPSQSYLIVSKISIMVKQLMFSWEVK